MDALETHAVQQHSALILPMIDAVLARGGIALAQLDAIAFGAGPGSFTGLRIACGVAQGLAGAAELKVVAVSTLEATAEAVGAARVLSALDARMDEIYLAAYARAGDGWVCVVEPVLCSAADAPELPDGEWSGCGSAFAVHAPALRRRYGTQLHQLRPEIYAHARDIARVAARVLAAGGGVDAAQAVPLYVRDKVALTVAERQAARSAP